VRRTVGLIEIGHRAFRIAEQRRARQVGGQLNIGRDGLRLPLNGGVLNHQVDLGVDPRQVALAWLLGRSSQILPIPGSGSPEHVAANVAAASLELTPDESDAILQLAQ